jgi:integrase
MGYIQARKRNNGYSFTAYTRDADGNRISLGTFPTREQAQERIDNAPSKEESKKGVLSKNTSVEEFFYKHYLPTLGPTTRLRYRNILRNHILPVIGTKEVGSVTRQQVSVLLDSIDLSAQTVRIAKSILSGGFNHLVDAEIIQVNPCTRVKVRKKAKIVEDEVLEPDQMKRILKELESRHGVPARLFAAFLIETGCRYGEAAEIRPRDINWSTGVVSVRRSVAYTGSEGNPDNSGVFWVKTPKSGKARVTTLSESVLEELRTLRDKEGIADDDLLFHGRLFGQEDECMDREVTLTEELIESLGFTEQAEDGYIYRHGTYAAYVHAKCRCLYCGQARREYRRKTNAPRARNITGHLSPSKWRKIWRDAANASMNGGWLPRSHDMRHAHASWILEAGVDLHSVKERMGHSSIVVTERYLHRIKAKKSTGADIVRSVLS